MNLTQAAAHLGAALATVRTAIEGGHLTALHPLADGPWIVRREELDRPEVRAHFARLRRSGTRREEGSVAGQNPTLPGL
jgi:hypothetical protein